MLNGPFEMFALGDTRERRRKAEHEPRGGLPQPLQHLTAERGTRLTPMRTQERVFQHCVPRWKQPEDSN